MTQVPVLIIVESDKASMPTMISFLETHGLNVTRIRPALGVIGGNLNIAKIDDFSQIPGVQSIQQEDSDEMGKSISSFLA
jgi:hypothetical protein